uniref:ribonuclease H n=1 Tax=Lepisosteus oculatus TaxID=7918 RepID=W5NL88_LEPOC
RLQEGGIIEPVDASPWVSNLVVAKKKSGGLQVCLDLKAVNKAVIPDKNPLPTVEFSVSTVFTKLDLRRGYLQIPLHPNSQNLTAVVTHIGAFCYTVVPCGLSSAPSCFQKVTSTIFAGTPGMVIYINDIVVHGPTLASHDELLHRVFKVLNHNHLTLTRDKCVFATDTIEFVSFRLRAAGLTPASNIEAIQHIPEPTTPAQVASFLGMTANYLQFLPHYSATTAPLRQLLQKDAPWVWNPACSEAVRLLKVRLTSPSVLAHLDFPSPTLVTCDASSTAVGAVLYQLHNGVEQPIAIASRALSPMGKRNSVGEWEALVCVWA